jgi:hypothetical protein
MTGAKTGAYHWLRPELDGPRVLVPAGLAAVDLGRGQWLERAPAAPWAFVLEPPGVSPPHWLGDRIPLVSATLLAALGRAGVDNVQTFPAQLRGAAAGAVWPGYVAFNVVGAVDAADPEASIGAPLSDGEAGPKVTEYSELVLSRARTHDLDMFRLADSPSMLLVHDRVMRALSAQAPPQGWGFTAIEIELR